MRQALAAVKLLCGAALVLAAPRLRAQGDEGIRRPEQLTVGVSDEFLGQLAPDGKLLYFLSNRNTLHEVYQQEVETARVTPLFDEGADVTWARVSPDGRNLLYISYRDDAAGQLCVRELPREAPPPRRPGSEPLREVPGIGPRRCLEDGSRALQAQWLTPQEIIMVSRASVQGDLRVTRVGLGRRLSARPLLERNLTSPTLSPDGRWLLYVPVERYVDGVGPGFAARAARRLEAVRLDKLAAGAPAPAQPLPLDLPGWTGQPAFSADGRALYFSQFFNDSNHDGTIDGSDNAVLFRVPFQSAREDAPALAAAAFPEQLTDSSWNCQYPSPAATQLVTTCARAASLDIYGLPLDGVVPSSWDDKRLQMEADLSTRRADLLLLQRHLLAREADPVERRRAMTRLIVMHQELDEFDAAEFYARKLGQGPPDATLEGLEPVLLAQIAQHRGARRRERGRAGGFRDEARARLQALPADGPGSPSARALRRITRCEIHDALGDKGAARTELEAVDPAIIEVPAVLDALHNAADALYRELDDDQALYALSRRLAEHPRLGVEERLRYARAAVRSLIRGRSQAEAAALLTRERGGAPPESELAFALELAQTTQAIREAEPAPEVVEAVLALYRRQKRADRRHALVVAVGQRVNETGAEEISEALVQLYVDDVPRGTRERRRAERMYRRFLEGRAYGDLAEGRESAARDTFARVARATGSLESHVEYISLLLREGKTPAEIRAEYAKPGSGHSDAATRFVRAYLLSLELPSMPKDGERYRAASREATTTLRGAWSLFHAEPAARVLLGSLLHQRFLRLRDLQAAQRADTHYLVALGMLKNNPRYRALVLEQLGLLQAQVGNYHLALGYLSDREKLPFPDPGAHLVHLMAKAQTLLHLEQDAEAAAAAEQALALLEKTPALQGFRPLVLDRAALYNLAAGRGALALQRYDALLPLLPPAPRLSGPPVPPAKGKPRGDSAEEAARDPALRAARNHLLLRLSRAAAALAAAEPRRTLEDLALVEAQLGDARLHPALAWPHTPILDTVRAYRQLLFGLRARAHIALQQRAEAGHALEQQRALLKERADRTGLEEHRRPLALIETQLADNAAAQRRPAQAGRWLQQALDHATRSAGAGAPPSAAVSSELLSILWLAAELQVVHGPALGLDVSGRLRTIQQTLGRAPTPTPQTRSARLLTIYDALLTPRTR